MQEEKKEGASGLPIAGVLIMLAALGFIAIRELPLRGSRPEEPRVQEYRPTEKVRARLWEDPFAAVMRHREKAERGETSEDNSSNTFEAAFKNVEHACKITVLGVMVFGDPYSEAAEWRLRSRYAALCGLRRSGYIPMDADFIGYVNTANAGGDALLPPIIPYEWLEAQDNKEKERVLVIWLNDDFFHASPLNLLASVIGEIKSGAGQRELAFKILGPAGSTTLLAMVKEGEEGCVLSEKLRGVEVYSATATAPDQVLLGHGGGEIDDQGKAAKVFEENNLHGKFDGQGKVTGLFEVFKKNGLYFVRTISTDDQLADQLIEELSRRDVTLSCRGKESDCREDHVALVAEWDTFYGRSLPKTFVDAVREISDNEQCHPANEQTEDLPWIHRFSYLRGIDGKIPGEKNPDTKPSSDSDADVEEDTDRLERSYGRSQYDYLRRLGDRVFQLNERLKRNGKGSIKAIGVLGSDFYDKLLVLQALRQRFPDALFFTTDLDARLLHPANSRWTRNVIVASSFGLELREEIQGDVPPFRDNYQTSVFLSTLIALKTLQKNGEDRVLQADMAGCLKPRVFEIGRREAFDLSVPTEDSKSATEFSICQKGLTGIYPPRSMAVFSTETMSMFAIVLFFALILICFTSEAVRETVRRFLQMGGTLQIVSLVVGTLGLVGMWWVSIEVWNVLNDPAEEPFTLLGGISIWPTVALRLVAAVMAACFVARAYASLKRNSKELTEEFTNEFSLASNSASGLLGDEADKTEACVGPGGRIYRRIKRVIKMITIDHWCSHGTTGAADMKRLWQEYLYHGSLLMRLVRLVPVVVTYIIFALFIFKTFGFPVVPARGETSRLIDGVVIAWIAVPLFMILIFFMVDATRLCSCWIKQITKKEVGLTLCDLRSHWSAIRLIAKRTEVVGRLIYYPFLVFFVLFISRIRYFDNYHFPVSLLIVMSLTAIYAVSAGIRLRRAAEKARSTFIESLTDRLASPKGAEEDKCSAEQIQTIINRIASLRNGAFAPLTRHPVVRAALLPFGSIGGVAFLDYLSKALH